MPTIPKREENTNNPMSGNAPRFLFIIDVSDGEYTVNLDHIVMIRHLVNDSRVVMSNGCEFAISGDVADEIDLWMREAGLMLDHPMRPEHRGER